MHDTLSGRVVLLTGASAGIGAALAQALGRRGASLVLVARRQDRLDALVQALRQQGVTAHACVADVTRDGDIEKAVALAHQHLGKLDVVIANAGFGIVGPLASLSLDDFRRQLDTNLFGVLRTFVATREDLLAQRGRLAVVGSVSGFLAAPTTGAYTMSKFAVRAFCETLAMELSPVGVSVTHIIPGFVQSEIRQVDNQGHFAAHRRDPVPPWLAMPATQAAHQICQAIERRKTACVLTRHGQLALFLAQHTPALLRAAGTLVARRNKRP